MAKPAIDARLKHEADGFTEVVERGRGSLRSRRPGTNQYALSAQVGNVGWHRGAGPFTTADEIDTDWQPTTGTWDYEMTQADYQAYIDTAGNYRYEDFLTGEYVNLNVTFFGWTNDEGASQQIPFNQVTPSVSGDVLTWAALFGSGTTLRIQTQTARLAKFLDVDNLTDLPAPTIGGTNIQLTFSYQMQRSSDLDVYVDGSKWNNNSTTTTATNVEFRQKSTGQPIWWFRTPIAWDANFEQVEGTQTLKRAGANLFVDGHIPYSWISAAAFPITIDPTVDTSISAGNYDASERSDDVNFDSSSAVVYCDSDVNAYNRFVGGFVFAVSGPGSGDTVDNCYIEVDCINAANDDPNVTIYFEDEDDANDFTTEADVVNRTLTTATGSWIATGIGTSYASSGNNSLDSMCQEVLDRPGWASGNNMCVIFWGNSDSHQDFLPRSYDGSSSEAAKFHLEYSVGGYSIDLDAGSYSVTGQAASLLANRALDFDAGAYSVSGFGPDLLRTFLLSTETGVYAITGQDPDMIASRVLGLDAGSYTVTGLDPDLLRNYLLSLDAGSYSVTGQDLSLLVSRLLGLDVGSYTISGLDITLTYNPLGGYQIDLDAGAYTITGLDPSLIVSRLLGLDTGVYNLTGQDPGLLVSRLLGLDAGSYTMTGQDPSLLISRLLNLDAGSYTVTGLEATLTYNPLGGYQIDLDPGSYTITGQDASLIVSRLLTAEAGVYTVTGQDAELLRTFILNTDAGSYTVTGQDIGFLIARVIGLDAGSYTITGQDPSLAYSGISVPAARIYVIPTEDRVFVVVTENRSMAIAQEDRVHTIL